MAIDKQRIYYNAVLGAMGGLLGWAFISIALRNLGASSTFMLYVKDALTGALVGIAIGAALGSVEGLTGGRSGRKLFQGMGYGGALGLAAGFVGLLLGEIIFSLAGGGVLPRAIGWAIFGALVGMSDGIANKMPTRRNYGLLGGFIGGLVGGSAYERINLALRGWTGDRETALAVGGAVGLIILGACLGAIIGLVETIMRTAWFRFTRGRLEGQTRMLDPRKPQITIGRNDASDLYIPGDTEIHGAHAILTVQNGAFTITPAPGGGPVLLITSQGEQAVQNYPLRPNDTIQLGRSRMIFYTEEEA
jgi:MFS family permease